MDKIQATQGSDDRIWYTKTNSPQNGLRCDKIERRSTAVLKKVTEGTRGESDGRCGLHHEEPAVGGRTAVGTYVSPP